MGYADAVTGAGRKKNVGVPPGQDGLQQVQRAVGPPQQDNPLLGICEAGGDVGGDPLDGGGGPADTSADAESAETVGGI